MIASAYMYGSLDVTRDKQGLKQAQALKALLDQAIERLQAEKDLPDTAPPPSAPRKVRNPFA